MEQEPRAAGQSQALTKVAPYELWDMLLTGLCTGIEVGRGLAVNAGRWVAGNTERPAPAPRFDGKTALVTGASSGIGYEVAAQLAEQGAAVALASQTLPEAQHALEKVRARAPGARLWAFGGDLLSAQETTQFVQDVQQQLPAIDILVNNAGIARARRRVTAEGFEETFQVNCVAGARITRALLPRLGQVLFITSGLLRFSRLELDDLSMSGSFSHLRAYANSKCAQVLFAQELAKRERVLSNTFDPGPVFPTRIAQSSASPLADWMERLHSLVRPFGSSPATCATAIVRVLGHCAHQGLSGAHYRGLTRESPGISARHAALAEKLWSALV